MVIVRSNLAEHLFAVEFNDDVDMIVNKRGGRQGSSLLTNLKCVIFPIRPTPIRRPLAQLVMIPYFHVSSLLAQSGPRVETADGALHTDRDSLCGTGKF